MAVAVTVPTLQERRDRFMIKVKLGEHATALPSPCWVWQGTLKDGYGRYWENSRAYRAHRVSYELFRGRIPADKVLDHLCRNRACVNPQHLDLVPQRTNILRGANHVAAQAQRTHCPAGHAYDAANTYRDSQGRRYCRACQRERQRARRAS